MNAYVLVFAAALLWGLIGAFSRGLLEMGVAPLEQAFWRAAIAGALFALHAALAREGLPKSGRDLLGFALFSLVGVTVFYASFALAVAAGGITLATILLYTAPAFVALLAWGLLRETMTARKLGLVAMTLCGVALVSLGGGEGVRVSPLSLFWGLAAGLSYSSYYLFGKWALQRYAPVAIYAVVLPLGALSLLPLVAFSPKSASAWGLLALLAVFSTYLAYLLYYTGLRTIEASRAVLVASVEPAFAALLAALIFGERFGALGLVGAGLVLLAAVLASLPAREAPEQEAKRAGP
ncbi:MAG: DMT family transporter [Deinococcota bacterium]|nr:DMT family transporter [Deinococcota bacterium]